MRKQITTGGAKVLGKPRALDKKKKNFIKVRP